MAKKETYFSKHKALIHGTTGNVSNPKINIKISEDAKAAFAEGKVLLIDKPLHWTSFDVVRKIRNSIQIKKVGHAGTLDPLATGLLIVCTGKFTKKINDYMAQQKEYTGSITLGATTPTYDLESEPENVKNFDAITLEMIHATVSNFLGEIEQLPPVYSAIKKEGVPLYQLARRGEAVTPEPRKIRIDEFEIVKVQLPVIYFRVVCSTGTYIRSLAQDFGQALGCGGYLSELRRTKIGDCKVEDAIGVDQFIQSLQ